MTGDYTYENGYGASVIDCGYGRASGLYEVAVTDATGTIVYDTPITSDVVGWLDAAGVAATLAKIAALPPRGGGA